MILSFFVFLLISFSILFGLASYATGLHNEMPKPILQSQKYETSFGTYSTTWDQMPNENGDFETNTYSQEVKDDLISVFKNELITEDYIDPSKQESDITNTDINKLVQWVVNNYTGNIANALDRAKKGGYAHSDRDVRLLQTAENNILDRWSNTNLVSYTLGKYIFPSYYSNMEIWDWWRSYSFNYAANKSESYYLMDSHNSYQENLVKSGTYETKKYLNDDNVMYLSTPAAEKFHYKKGQKVTVKIDGAEQDFTYGGKASFATSMNVAKYNNQLLILLVNYKPAIKDGKKVDLRLHISQQDAFLIRDINGKNNKHKQFDKIFNIAKNNIIDQVNGSERGWNIQDYIFTSYIFYIGMMMFSVIVDILMVILDIVVAWFLIKEIIRSLSTQLLFLKTLGMTNNEASLITSVTLLIIMIFSLGLALVGMLGIQALFISITSKFVDEYNVLSTIKPFSLVIIFGVAIFLLVIYVISSLSLLKKIDLTSNSAFNKAGSGLRGVRGYLFSRSVNSGLTFSFTMKNLKKIISTFIITALVTMLSFIAIGFKTAMDRGIGNLRSFTNHQETAQLNFADGWVNHNPDHKYMISDGTLTRAIKYSDSVIDKSMEITEDNFVDVLSKKDVQGMYITRNTFSKLLKDDSELLEMILPANKVDSIKKEWIQICNKYDESLKVLWPKAERNFTINMGELYTANTQKEAGYSLNGYLTDGSYRGGTLVVINDDDSRAKKIFKVNNDITYDDNNEPIVPVTVSSRYLRYAQLDEGEVSGESNVDFHLRENIDPVIGGLWPQADLFKMKYSSSNLIEDAQEVYIRKSDFVTLLKHFENAKPVVTGTRNNATVFYKDLINDYQNNNQYNMFMNKGLPLMLQQLVVQYERGTTLKDYLTTLVNQTSSNNLLTNGKITYYKLEIDANKKLLSPIMNTMIVILILVICLVVAFIIFMVMSIMNENDDVIFIMKALGYSRGELLWRITAGYIIAIWVSVVIGVIIAAVILEVMNKTFIQILYLDIILKFNGPVAGLFFALMIALPLFILGISAYRIKARNLVTLDNE